MMGTAVEKGPKTEVHSPGATVHRPQSTGRGSKFQVSGLTSQVPSPGPTSYGTGGRHVDLIFGASLAPAGGQTLSKWSGRPPNRRLLAMDRKPSSKKTKPSQGVLHDGAAARVIHVVGLINQLLQFK